MVMSISTTQSVLWDQIQYAGEPEEFAWVLPVQPGARVEASTSAFFEVLEALTAVGVQPPFVDCGGGSGCDASRGDASFGVNLAAEDDSAGGFDQPIDPVQVVHQGTVGPYETVTLSTEQPGALNDWLESHGYNVDDSAQPIIDQYVADGFDFIALRLQPGKGVQQMTPVRVVMSGAVTSLPLRMVGIGTGAQTPIVLYVIAEGRYRTQNFEQVTVSTELLSYDFKTEESNYTELRDRALSANDGASFVTAYANPGFFTNTSIFDPDTQGATSFLQLYVKQALQNGESPNACQVPYVPTSGEVMNPCPPDEPWDSPACGTVSDFESVDARKLGCRGVEDVAVALEGMRIESVWVTRLEAVLPRSALATDLTLQAASQESVSNILQALIALSPEDACANGAVPRTIGLGSDNRPSTLTAFAAALLGGLAMAFAARRARLAVSTTNRRGLS